MARPVPEPSALARAVDVVRSARRPLVVAGGGVIYSDADAALRAFAEATGIPVAETQAGKGSLPFDHPRSLGAIGATGTTAADALAEVADVVIGVGTRYSDFTTASRTVFADPGVRFVNLNVSSFDAHKLSAVSVVADAREALDRADRRSRRLDGRRRPHRPGRAPRAGVGRHRPGCLRPGAARR